MGNIEKFPKVGSPDEFPKRMQDAKAVLKIAFNNNKLVQ
jgi:hypothetical protein